MISGLGSRYKDHKVLYLRDSVSSFTGTGPDRSLKPLLPGLPPNLLGPRSEETSYSTTLPPFHELEHTTKRRKDEKKKWT